MAAAVDPIQQLILELARLPGIGERTAARLAFYIVHRSHSHRSQGQRGQGHRSHAERGGTSSAPPSMARDLAAALERVAAEVVLCRRCRAFCSGPECSLCNDARRDASVLCVVEGVAEQRAIEQSGAFRGRYHVLHGVLAPLDGVGPAELDLDGIANRVRHENITEVIVATNADVEGDATALYLARLLGPIGARVTRLASGIPLGGELEYLDAATLGRAISDRRDL